MLERNGEPKKKLVGTLVVLPVLLGVYLIVCLVCIAFNFRVSWIPQLRPPFLLLFLADLFLLSFLHAWATVVFERRQLGLTNFFRVFEGSSIRQLAFLASLPDPRLKADVA